MEWGYNNTPEAEAFGKRIGLSGAAATNNTDLEDAISDGTVTVYPGQPPPGCYAYSFRNPDGTYVIVVTQEEDMGFFYWGIVHEWSHISSGDPVPPKDGGTGGAGGTTEPTEEEKRQQACDEYGAHCTVLREMIALAEHSYPVTASCVHVNMVFEQAGWEALWCSYGTDAMGPPSPELCDPPLRATDIPCH